MYNNQETMISQAEKEKYTKRRGVVAYEDV